MNVSSYLRCRLLTSIKILGLTVFVFCQRKQQMMTTLCPFGIDLKFSTASCHSPPLLVARCGSRQARHAVWQDEKISHSLKSSAAATLQSLRNVPSLWTYISGISLCPFSIPFPTSMSMSMSMSMAGAGQLVSILVFSFEFGFRLQFGASTTSSSSYSTTFYSFFPAATFSPFWGFPFWQLAEQTERWLHVTT